jgi:plastocyanin
MFTQYEAIFPKFPRAAWVCALLWMTGAQAVTVEVQVENFQFSPPVVNINPGDTVRWTWSDGGHSVTSGANCTANGRFDTGIKGAGFTTSMTFDQPGQIPYFCSPHCSIAMTGLVKVAGSTPPPGGKIPKKPLLDFQAMHGVDGLFVGEQNPVRDVVGDELPWTIKSVKGQLLTNGQLTIQVRGLVFTDDPSVPDDKRGINDETQFRGLVSCLTEEGDQIVTKNVATQGFPATSTGNANIKATVALPNPCIAPIVMVIGGSEDNWFAITGFEAPQ